MVLLSHIQTSGGDVSVSNGSKLARARSSAIGVKRKGSGDKHRRPDTHSPVMMVPASA